MSDNHVTLCVVIPMYNAEATIINALDSISKQTRLPDHVIIVDDGSQDKSAGLVESYASDYPITLIKQQNAGPSAARNKGIFQSQEEIICFLDADDAWVNTKLERQTALYEKLTADGHHVGLMDCFETVHYMDNREQVFNRIKSGNHFQDFVAENIINGTSCVFARREALVAIGGFDQEIRFAEDRWLWTQVAENYEVHTVPEVLSHRYIAATNITSNPKKYYSHKLKFIDKFVAKYGQRFSQQQLNQFVIDNLSDFLRAFSRDGDYASVKVTYEHMLSRSASVIFYKQGKMTFRYLHALFMLVFKRNATGATS